MHSSASSTTAEDHGLLYCALGCGSLMQLFKGGIHRDLKTTINFQFVLQANFPPINCYIYFCSSYKSSKAFFHRNPYFVATSWKCTYWDSSITLSNKSFSTLPFHLSWAGEAAKGGHTQTYKNSIKFHQSIPSKWRTEEHSAEHSV